jgi:hypothetical protein
MSCVLTPMEKAEAEKVLEKVKGQTVEEICKSLQSDVTIDEIVLLKCYFEFIESGASRVIAEILGRS